MSLGINLLMYLTEIASKSLGNNFLSKVFETHHKFKKDHPSGTALMLGQGIATGKIAKEIKYSSLIFLSTNFSFLFDLFSNNISKAMKKRNMPPAI